MHEINAGCAKSYNNKYLRVEEGHQIHTNLRHPPQRDSKKYPNKYLPDVRKRQIKVSPCTVVGVYWKYDLHGIFWQQVGLS